MIPASQFEYWQWLSLAPVATYAAWPEPPVRQRWRHTSV